MLIYESLKIRDSRENRIFQSQTSRTTVRDDIENSFADLLLNIFPFVFSQQYLAIFTAVLLPRESIEGLKHLHLESLSWSGNPPT